MGDGRGVGREAGEGIGSWWLLWAVGKKTQVFGSFLLEAYYSGTTSGQLYLLLLVTEYILAHVHDTEIPESLFLWPPGF